MDEVNILHQNAMTIFEWAEAHRMRGKMTRESRDYQCYVRTAYTLESKAAELCPSDVEPTKSVLTRSARDLGLMLKK